MRLQRVNLCNMLGRVQAGLLELILRLHQLVEVKVLPINTLWKTQMTHDDTVSWLQ